MSKPRLLDLFCGAGGAAMGYHRAGFEVVGVDIEPQPRYPFEFLQFDALKVLEDTNSNDYVRDDFGIARFGTEYEGAFHVVHASPPCQAFTAYRRTGRVKDYPDLIEPTRELLNRTGLPWVMENVEGAPLNDPLVLCGSMFEETMDIRRHRFFETNWPVAPPTWPCRHRLQADRRFPGGRSVQHTGNSRGAVRATIEIGSWDIPLNVQQKAMGMDWSTLEELSEAIPPTYTEFIGHQLMQYLRTEEE